MYKNYKHYFHNIYIYQDKLLQLVIFYNNAMFWQINNYNKFDVIAVSLIFSS
jgi:hypothetical protein